MVSFDLSDENDPCQVKLDENSFEANSRGLAESVELVSGYDALTAGPVLEEAGVVALVCAGSDVDEFVVALYNSGYPCILAEDNLCHVICM